MTAAHLHLWLNHVPVVGIVFALIVLGVGAARRDRAAVQLACWLLVGLALVTMPVYLSGQRAEALLDGAATFSEARVEEHEEAALVAFVAMEILGVAALAALVGLRRTSLPAWAVPLLALVTGVVAGLLVWTAYLGGQVNHPEIR
jgi:protein-S-isoprenylcysteine O-methyltransferase Ste14